MAVSPIIHQNARDERARNLEAKGFNGLRMALVDLLPAGSPVEARLELFFFNANHRNDIRNDASTIPSNVFTITGGSRMPAGSAEGQVRVTAVANGTTNESLFLTVEPIGDYSTYALVIDHNDVDPFFSELPFKFRPGCFTADCEPEWEPAPAPKSVPPIDYLARDYDSFRHALIAAMMQRVPGWRSTSEADLDQVLIDLFAAAGDELSDFQDRVMNEAYFATCRERVSLARHARLMDYHIHQGNQASTWLTLHVTGSFKIDAGLRLDPASGPAFNAIPTLEVWTAGSSVDPITNAQEPLPQSIIFASRDESRFDPLLNNLRFYTWDDAVPALAAGSTSADLIPDIIPLGTAIGAGSPTLADAQALVDLIRGTAAIQPPVRYLLVQEHLNPETGQEPGRDPEKRQLLRLVVDGEFPKAVEDPINNRWVVRVKWDDADQLQHDYCFTSFINNVKAENISVFHGNLVKLHHGHVAVTTFYESGSNKPEDDDDHGHRFRYFERTERTDYKEALCTLPDSPLAYLPTSLGGEVPPMSTLHVQVEQSGGGTDEWDEVISLVHSDDSAEEGDHFAVETDERQLSLLRFGNGVNGQELPSGAKVHCAYQIGGGTSGNVGADSLLYFDPTRFPQISSPPTLWPRILPCWNPFDVTDGCDPESVQKILRAVPEAYRVRQLRAVTLADYINRAQEVEGVSRAVARYAWTGSWRTVRLAIDPEGTVVLSQDLRARVAQHIETVRLIGEDIEIRPPRYVPLEIEVKACVHPEFWPEDVRAFLEQEFSDGYTPDGRTGFFHPDNWTFGQPLHKSEIEGRIHRVRGIEHIIWVQMQRFNEATPGASSALIEVRTEEIIQVQNDPDHRERGFIDFILEGGRQ